MAEEHEIVVEENTNGNRNGATSRLSKSTTVSPTSKFAASLKSFLRSGCNMAGSPSGTPTSRSAAGSSSGYSSTRIPDRIVRVQRSSGYPTELEFEIEASKVHWSELTSVVVQPAGRLSQGVLHEIMSESTTSELVSPRVAAEGHLSARERNNVIERLRKKWPQSGSFFLWAHESDEFEMGEKIAEGAQAEIFEAYRNIEDDGKIKKLTYALKVFREGSSLQDLQKQWPSGIFLERGWHYGPHRHASPILSGMLLNNGRFAFQMRRYWGDLRKLIDLRAKYKQGPLFSNFELKYNMFRIAKGLQRLHRNNIVHRDIKASNVLIQPVDEGTFDPVKSCAYYIYVADYECSIGVVGTGYWRAPEILLAMKNSNIPSDLFTQKSDVYSYAMTCYEMITGKIPFEDLPRTKIDGVLGGERPKLPKCTKPWIRELLASCWHQNPLERPTFQDIANCFEPTLICICRRLKYGVMERIPFHNYDNDSD